MESYMENLRARMKLGSRLLGDGAPCFIIAEVGVNHNGDCDLAREMIYAAKHAGADAVKFQTFKAEKIVTKDAQKAAYQKETTGERESQYQMIKKLELKEDDFRELARYAKSEDIIFLSTPFDIESADFLEELNIPAFKVASGEINNLPLIRHIARKKKPIILSTGMSSLGDIEVALQALQSEGLEEIVLLHCTTSYPARAEDVNLRALHTLSCAFKLPIGFSDHTEGISAALAAVALGACIVEKHFTTDKKLPGPDHSASVEPQELQKMVKGIRRVEMMLGSGLKKPTHDEEEIAKLVRRSLVASVDLPAGINIERGMLDIKRPGTGIEPKFLDSILGRKTRVDLKKDDLLTWDMIE
jgi:N,N'-diacetyllegionaminate synthase